MFEKLIWHESLRHSNDILEDNVENYSASVQCLIHYGITKICIAIYIYI